MALVQAVQTQCFHCGDSCEANEINFDDKSFCCEGCRTVYEILHSKDLCTYYDLEQSPGISAKSRKNAQSFDYLDVPEISDKLWDYRDEQIASVSFYLPQVHCASCIWLLENLYKLNPAISQSKVNFLRKEISIVYAHERIRMSEVVGLLTAIGYEPEIRLNKLEKGAKTVSHKTFFYRLGVAGFCFGNIMLMSFPEYLSGSLLESSFQDIFGYLNLLLALPVLLYSSYPYFQSAWYGIRQQHLNLDIPIALGILVLFGRSAYEILSHSGAGYMDSLAGLVFFLLIGKWFQQKTYDAFAFDRDYKSYFPLAATRMEGKAEVSTPITQLQVGDRILIRNQELVPADAILIRGQGQIDYSFVTGESVPVSKKEGSLLYAGGRQVGAGLEVELVKDVSQSYLTQLWDNQVFANKERNPGLSDRFSKYFTLIVLLVATLAGAYWLMYDWKQALNVFTAVLIISCPCALALTVPVTLGNALRIMGRHKIYLKNIQAIERMAEISHIVFDKTGTLTAQGKVALDISLEELSEDRLVCIKSLVRNSAHPVSKAIYEALPQVPTLSPTAFSETPGMGLEGIVDGHMIKIGSSAWIWGENAAPNKTGTYISIDGEVVCSLQTQNYYREGLSAIVDKLASYKLSVLSGDNDKERERLHRLMGEQTTLLFQRSPHDKLDHIKSLQEQGEKVAMIGDGLNDAGALMQSEVGIAITEDVKHFTPACDAILDGSGFRLIPDFFKFSRAAVKKVYQARILSLAYNIVGVSFAVQGKLSPLLAAIFMPLSSVTIVAFGLIGTWYISRQIIDKNQSLH